MQDDDRSHNLFGLLMSLNMLIETPAGFRETRVEHLVGPDSIVMGIK